MLRRSPLFALLGLCGLAAGKVKTDQFLYSLGEQGRKDGLTGTWMEVKGMPFYISLPTTSAEDRSFVIIAHHAVGIYNDNFLRKFCDNLAREGFVCLLPDFFHRVWSDTVPNGFGTDVGEMKIGEQLKSQRDAEILEDLENTINFAKEVSGSVKGGIRVGVVGFCLGGRISWLAGTAKALSQDVQGVVAYHGGNIWKAYPEDEGTAPGDNLEALHCPVLGHFAGLDQNPSPADQDKLQTAGKTLGKDMEFYSYAGVKHGFSCSDSSFYDAAAADTAWPRTVAFLHKALGAKDEPSRVNEL